MFVTHSDIKELLSIFHRENRAHQHIFRNYNQCLYILIQGSWIEFDIGNFRIMNYFKKNVVLSLTDSISLLRNIKKHVKKSGIIDTASESIFRHKSPFPIEIETHLFSFLADDDTCVIPIKIMNDLLLSDEKIKEILQRKYYTIYKDEEYAHFFSYAKQYILCQVVFAIRFHIMKELSEKKTQKESAKGKRFKMINKILIENMIYRNAQKSMLTNFGSGLYEGSCFFLENVDGLLQYNWTNKIPDFISRYSNHITFHDKYYIRQTIIWFRYICLNAIDDYFSQNDSIGRFERNQCRTLLEKFKKILS
jgi:hypothetical protein